MRAGKLVTVDRELAEQHYAEHAREAVLRRARRVHHLGADARARPRGRGRDRGRALDDGLDEPGRRRRRGRSAATSRSRCRTTSCTAPTRPSRPRARSRSGSAMSSPDALRNRDAWDRTSDEYQERHARVHRAAGRAALGDVAAPGVGARDPRRRRRQGRARARLRRGAVVDPARAGRARGSSGSTTRRGSSSTRAS